LESPDTLQVSRHSAVLVGQAPSRWKGREGKGGTGTGKKERGKKKGRRVEE
jgi:hypothetical protein